MLKQSQEIDIEIDKLTNSIENAITGDSFETEISLITKEDLKRIRKGNGWQFDWKYEFEQSEREVYKLTIKNNLTVIQGVVSIQDNQDHYYLHLIESAPFNKGNRKMYVGVAGNLIAYVCKVSWNKGYEGFVTFISKSKLIKHYEKTLGAEHIGGHKMVIFPKRALTLIKKYFDIK